MRAWLRPLTCAGLIVAFGACTRQELPPALPEPVTIFQTPTTVAPLPVVEAPVVELARVPVTELPKIAPIVEEVAPSQGKRGKTLVREDTSAEGMIAAANQASRVAPMQAGYHGGTAIQRYPYRRGKVYEVYTSPLAPLLILLPEGEHLVAPPAADSEQWDIGMVAMGTEGIRQEAVMVRPVAAGQELDTTLLTDNRHAFLLHLRSSAKTAMLGVEWEMPSMRFIREEEGEVPAQGKGGKRQAPTVDVSRLHTAYKIEGMKGNLPWVPLAVYDDGVKTVVKFRESLQFTNAPGVFTVNIDKSPGVVQFTTYEVPGAPEQGAYYVIEAIWPQLQLKGTGGQELTITRLSTAPKPFVEAGHAK